MQQEGFKKHLGIWYNKATTQSGEKYLSAHTKDSIENIIETYKKSMGKTAKKAATPGTPGLSMTKNEGKVVYQSQYQTVVRKLIYAVFKVIPKAANATRELA